MFKNAGYCTLQLTVLAELGFSVKKSPVPVSLVDLESVDATVESLFTLFTSACLGLHVDDISSPDAGEA